MVARRAQKSKSISDFMSENTVQKTKDTARCKKCDFVGFRANCRIKTINVSCFFFTGLFNPSYVIGVVQFLNPLERSGRWF